MDVFEVGIVDSIDRIESEPIASGSDLAVAARALLSTISVSLR